MQKLSKTGYILSRIAIIIVIFIVLFPLLWILSLSFRDNDSLLEAYAYLIPKTFVLENYTESLRYFNEVVGVGYVRMFLNSGLVVSASLILTIIIASFAGYSYSHFRFKGKDISYFLIVISMMIPAQILIIPLHYMFFKLKLIDTYLALIIPYTAFGIPISVLILSSFFGSIPRELRDSAIIDGASDFTYLVRIVLPLSRPAIATVVIFLFLFFWNEFIIATIFVFKWKLKTVPAVAALIGGHQYNVPWGTYAAAVNLTIFPILILFIVFQRWFIRGVTLGALKG